VFAAIAAVIIAVVALFHPSVDKVNLFYLGLAFWALHFAFDIPLRGGRRR
jgi:uncharacterized protein YqgC (DUF456 family)